MSLRTAWPSLNLDRAPAAVSICGVGGQGVVLAGVILGDAALLAGRWACQSAAYTVAARGGFARSEVIMAASVQACPLAESLDVLLALDDQGWLAEVRRLRPGGLAICSEAVAALPGDYTLAVLPLERLAREAGRPRSANIAGLGAILGLTGLVSMDALSQALRVHLGGASGDLAALAAGNEAGRLWLADPSS